MSYRPPDTSFFSMGKRSFWLLLLLLLGALALHLADALFDEGRVVEQFERLYQQEQLEAQLDSLQQQAQDSIAKENKGCPQVRYAWKWRDPYTQRNELLAFELCTEVAKKAGAYRKTLPYTSEQGIYSALADNDSAALHPLVARFRQTLKARDMNYLDGLRFVVGAIQAIPYTLVLNNNPVYRCPCSMGGTYYEDDCRVRSDRRGCCNDVEPYGVYSPLEFALRKTGDCDTRTLFAYAVLSALNYDITILNSDAEGHSILGVYSPKALGNGAFIRGKNGKKYYIWELTGPANPGIYTYNSSIDSWYSVMK